MVEIATMGAPRSPIYRVGRAPRPLAPPSWAYAASDGTFGNRFDDPSARRGVPPEDRFRMLYFATTSAGAFGETIARRRPGLESLARAGVAAVPRPVVSAAWRHARRLGVTVLTTPLPFVDISAGATMAALRPALATIAVNSGLPDVDLSAVTGPARLVTQEAARYLYDQHDDAGAPCYAGMRYLSRLNPAWECWAIFVDRLRHRVVQSGAVIGPSDPGLYEAAALLGLGIEDDHGRRHYP
jgi:hypothetical protein